MPSASKNALLLGMVYSEEFSPKRGQEYRDRIRCEALEKHGYTVRTLDNKHTDHNIASGKHCQANFADARRMVRSIESKWGKGQVFDEIILDYFFSPVGWARERWTDNLFIKTLPLIAKEGLLCKGGKILLPYLNCIRDSLAEFEEYLYPYYSITLQSDPKKNSLYLATEDVTDALLLCPDTLTNETQVAPLFNFSDTPFVIMELRSDFVTYSKVSPVKPSKKRTNMFNDEIASETIALSVQVVTPRSLT